MKENDILLPEEARKILSIGRNAIYSLLKTGELKGFRIGRQWRITQKALDEFINRGVEEE